jgi:serine phosphatase RsbU (regulator of sigma subunit)
VASLTKDCAKTPAAIVDGIVGDLQAFSNGMEPEDDQTLLVVGFD